MKHSAIAQAGKWCLFLVAIAAYVSTSAFAAPKSEPCSGNSETRQLDYWLGTWTKASPDPSDTSSDKVYLSLDECMFVEHWDSGKGHIADKMVAYSPESKNWYGMFADNEGRVHIFTDGKVAAGVAEFHGTSRDAKGEAVINRLRVVRLAPNKVEESWEKSMDKGVHWTTAYRADYSRANP